jgi:hypothetical protein
VEHRDNWYAPPPISYPDCGPRLLATRRVHAGDRSSGLPFPRYRGKPPALNPNHHNPNRHNPNPNNHDPNRHDPNRHNPNRHNPNHHNSSDNSTCERSACCNHRDDPLRFAERL